MTSPTPDLVPDLVPQDFTRSYSLADTVEASIPTTAQPGEPGIHWVARGLLSETCERLLADPVSLDCVEKRHTTFVSVSLSLASTAVAPDRRDVLVTVELLLDRRSGRWGLMFADRLIGGGRWLPSPSWLAERVAQEYDRRRRPVEVYEGPVPW